MKEAQPIADAGALNIEASQAPRRSAAEGGDVARATDAPATNGQPAQLERSSVSPESTEALAPEDADRFAMAFRPSWEPIGMAPGLSDAPSDVRFRSFAPSLAPVVPHSVQDAGGLLQDDLLRLRAARVRTRSLALAAVSVLSFAALMYWGISSTTDGADRSATRALPPPQAAAPTGTVEESAPPPPVAAPDQTRLTARLADPSAPPAVAAPESAAAAAAANEGPESELANTEAQPAEDAVAAQQPSNPAEQEQGREGEPAAAKPTHPAAADPTASAAAPLQPAATSPEPKPATITDVKPATAASEPKTPPTAAVAADAKPSTEQKPVAVTPPAAPPVVASKPAAASAETKPLAAAAEAKPVPPTAAVKPAAAASGSVVVAAAPRPAATPSEAPQPAAAQNTPASTIKPTPTTTEARPPLLMVRAVPDSAQLFLDGQRMSNPFDTRLPLGSKHKIDARQDGYETSSQSIRLEADAKLTITLKRTTPAPEPHLKVSPLPESANGAGFVTSNPY